MIDTFNWIERQLDREREAREERAEDRLMSKFANINIITAAPGVVAVARIVSNHAPLHDAREVQTREFRGVESWSSPIDLAYMLFAATDEDEMRVTIGEHTILVAREHSVTVAVVFPTGHDIGKSLRRMIRRACAAIGHSPAGLAA